MELERVGHKRFAFRQAGMEITAGRITTSVIFGKLLRVPSFALLICKNRNTSSLRELPVKVHHWSTQVLRNHPFPLCLGASLGPAQIAHPKEVLRRAVKSSSRWVNRGSRSHPPPLATCIQELASTSQPPSSV